NQQARLDIVEKYFAEAPSDNLVYEDMRVASLSSYAWARQTVSANELYASLQEQYATNNAMLASLHQSMLSFLEYSGDTAGQKKIYNFFRAGNNRIYLFNDYNYYIYTYKLALISYREGDYKAAEPLFREVAAQRNTPILAFFAESAEYYLQNIEDNRQ
ncbi:MAG: hypothetical protein LBD99_06095, partial [Candidatus Margulisbacteria bacterium]|nr:hypothetical protein [Candidatus Margulisiibacteriota bacterium]